MGNQPLKTKNKLQSICIVTNDFCIEQPRGGVGTFHFALANFLSENSYDVTVLLLNPERYNEEIVNSKKSQFKIVIPPKISNLDKASWSRRASYDVYSWLKENYFDCIHFHEWLGLGFYTLQAKKIGIEFQTSKICVGVHGPHEWILECNEQYISNPDLFEIFFMEKKSIEMADTLWSPSEYMLNWLRSHGYNAPDKTKVIPYLIPKYDYAKKKEQTYGGISKLVFIGRIEHRKGIKLICDAFEKIIEEHECNLSLIFIGPQGTVDSMPGYDYICMRSKNWRIHPTIKTGMNHKKLMEFIREPACAVLIPSLVDNSPLTVHECILYEIPCITIATGGIPEFVKNNEDALLKNASTESLIKALKKIEISPNKFILRYKNNYLKTEQKWLDFHTEVNEIKKEKQIEKLIISVCITHYERPEQLKRAIKSVLDQSLEALEIIIVDDGSESTIALETLKEIGRSDFIIPVKIIKQKNKFVGEARNECVKYASGDYIVFLDDDNVMNEDALKTLQTAIINSNADIVTTCYKTFKNQPIDENCKDLYLPLGGCLETGLLWNCFGDTFSIQSKELFLSQGGFEEDRDTKFEDWEYLAKLAHNDLNIEIIPEALCWNELSTPSLSTHSPHFYNLSLSIRPYSNRVPKWAVNLLKCIRGIHFEKTKNLNKKNDPNNYISYIVDTEIFYSLNKKTFKQLKPVHETELEFFENFLLINAKSEDPALLSPELPYPNSGKLFIMVEIEVANRSEFSVYFQKSDKPDYTEEQAVKKIINQGKNKFFLKLTDNQLSGRLRIDPGELKGKYKINSLEIRFKK